MSQRANIGCGPFPAKGWVNVDIREHEGVEIDVVASVLDLPFGDDEFEAVYAGHVLEHLYLHEIPSALEEIQRVLAPGGIFMVVGPDIEKAERLYPDSPELHDSIRGGGNIDGWEDSPHPGDYHHYVADGAKTLELLLPVFPRAREIPIETVSDYWPTVSKVEWQFAIYCPTEADASQAS